MNDLQQLADQGRQRAGDDSVFVHDLATKIDWTYGDMHAWTARFESYLGAAGVVEGDRVAYLTASNPRFLPLLLACARRGAALVPINPASHPKEVSELLRHAQPRAVLYDSEVEGSKSDWQPIGGIGLGEGAAASAGPVEADPDREALIIYTSGTTSRPKGVMLTPRSLCSMAETFVRVYGVTNEDRFLCVLPFFHINAPMITGLLPLLAGARVVLSSPYSFANARFYFDTVEQHGVTVLSLTPSIMASQLQLFAKGVGEQVRSVRHAMVGTAPLPEDLWRRYEERFGVACYQGYGLTETTTWATMTPPDASKRYDTVGLPLGGEIKIDPETGEISIRGDIVMKGYFAAKKATRSALRDGWMRTGDVGVIDPDGQLRVVGRIKNIIKRHGVLVQPETIDAALIEHPAIVAAATVGVPDELAGERVCSVIQWSDDPQATPPSSSAVIEHLRNGLSGDSIPDRVLFWPRLPRNPLGKPDLAELRALVSGRRSSELVDALSPYRVARSPHDDADRVERTIQHGIDEALRIEIAGYWGVGDRDYCAPVDDRALARLQDTMARVDEVLGVASSQLTLVLADVHGRINGVPRETAEPYLADIARSAAGRGFATLRLSEIWSNASIDPADVAEGIATAEFEALWSAHPLREGLLVQAARRCPEGRAVEEHARRYLWACLTERAAVSRALAGKLFFTYSPAGDRELLPDLPLLYWHSLKPGVARKPWFEEDTNSAEPQGAR